MVVTSERRRALETRSTVPVKGAEGMADVCAQVDDC